MLTDWGLPSQINFENFYLYIKFVLNSSDFVSKSTRQQSQIILEQTNIYINPRTITNYKNILLQKKLLYKSGRAIYYKQTDNGIIEICYKDYIDFTKSRRKKQEEGLDYNAALVATIAEKKGIVLCGLKLLRMVLWPTGWGKSPQTKKSLRRRRKLPL